MNSGAPQGNFLKRRMVLKQDGKGVALLPSDFIIGQDVLILERQIRICDCDQYTREFFIAQNKPQGIALPIPMDSFASSQIVHPKKEDYEGA